MKINIEFTLALAGSLALLLLGTGATPEPSAADIGPVRPPQAGSERLFANPVVARGRGFEIRRSEFEEAYITFRANAAARGQNFSESERATIEAQLLDRLVVTQLLMSRATAEDRAKAKESADKFIEQSKTVASSEEGFIRQLKALGLSVPKFQTRVFEQAMSEAVLDREIRAKLTITDDEARKFYEEHPKQFQEPEMVRLRHILLAIKDPATARELSDEQRKAKKAEATRILARARSGEDFATLAEKYSDDFATKDKGGETTVPRGRMVPELEGAAFSLEPNQISDIVTTAFGYHILKLEEKIPTKEIPFDKVADDIKDVLLNRAVQERLPEYFAKLKEEAKVEVLDEKLKLPEQASNDAGVAEPN